MLQKLLLGFFLCFTSIASANDLEFEIWRGLGDSLWFIPEEEAPAVRVMGDPFGAQPLGDYGISFPIPTGQAWDNEVFNLVVAANFEITDDEAEGLLLMAYNYAETVSNGNPTSQGVADSHYEYSNALMLTMQAKDEVIARHSEAYNKLHEILQVWKDINAFTGDAYWTQQVSVQNRITNLNAWETIYNQNYAEAQRYGLRALFWDGHAAAQQPNSNEYFDANRKTVANFQQGVLYADMTTYQINLWVPSINDLEIELFNVMSLADQGGVPGYQYHPDWYPQ